MKTTIANSLAARRASVASSDIDPAKDGESSREKGFTLVELLVVVVIIGILAAIAIPTFLNQRQAAWEAQVTSDIANAVIAVETIAVNNNGSYSSITTTDALKNAGYSKSADVTLTPAIDGAGYTISGRHSRLGTIKWTYTSSTGLVTESAVTAGT
ncbi:type IV pilus assembly protein PilA [Glaciihabitans tibetensis]|uniref:Type IV pilus assembly protein PilA n=1 Tax=Glaciihabitans tibetensis TaxID=1266600 RepID=A0A2T0VBS2_9MICO|nr:prepilin-type N-terminal cleavage/methylation domain-containing protein [Glaciihabitans tibetensis]PRY67537.1 type IV pilus assembly protein PilA [Glaciihabitans tibetensis]